MVFKLEKERKYLVLFNYLMYSVVQGVQGVSENCCQCETVDVRTSDRSQSNNISKIIFQ